MCVSLVGRLTPEEAEITKRTSIRRSRRGKKETHEYRQQKIIAEKAWILDNSTTQYLLLYDEVLFPSQFGQVLPDYSVQLGLPDLSPPRILASPMPPVSRAHAWMLKALSYFLEAVPAAYLGRKEEVTYLAVYSGTVLYTRLMLINCTLHQIHI